MMQQARYASEKKKQKKKSILLHQLGVKSLNKQAP